MKDGFSFDSAITWSDLFRIPLVNLVATATRVNASERERGKREREDAHRNPVGESVCLSVGVCEGGGVRPPPRERVSRAVAEGRRAECVCEAESELESVGYIVGDRRQNLKTEIRSST